MSRSDQDREFRNGTGLAGQPNPEVVTKARRRQFSRVYKLRILAEVEQCRRGEVGALLRREGLYSSMLSKWRQQQAAGKLDGSVKSQEGRGGEQAKEVKRLQRENARLKAELTKAEAIIEVQKKLSALLETMKS